MYLRHSTAVTGASEPFWTYDAAGRLVHVMLPGKCAFDVLVCSPHQPMPGAFPVIRLDEETFEITPTQYLVGRGGVLRTMAADIDPAVGKDVLMLIQVPESVASQLMALDPL